MQSTTKWSIGKVIPFYKRYKCNLFVLYNSGCRIVPTSYEWDNTKTSSSGDVFVHLSTGLPKSWGKIVTKVWLLTWKFVNAEILSIENRWTKQASSSFWKNEVSSTSEPKSSRTNYLTISWKTQKVMVIEQTVM